MNMAWSAPTQTVTVAAIHVPTPSMEIPSEIKSVTRTATKVAKPLKALTDRRPRARVTLRAGAASSSAARISDSRTISSSGRS